MTAVAVGDATVEEARTIRSAIHGALEDHETDGTPRRIDGSRSKGLILLKRGTDPTAVEFCVPLGNDRHAPLGAAIRVRWQESPDEPDVSGVFHCARPGRAVNGKTAGAAQRRQGPPRARRQGRGPGTRRNANRRDRRTRRTPRRQHDRTRAGEMERRRRRPLRNDTPRHGRRPLRDNDHGIRLPDPESASRPGPSPRA